MQHNSIGPKTADLIIKYLKGHLSEEEDLALGNWLRERPENSILFKKLTDKEFVRKELKRFDSFDENQAYKKIKQATTGKSYGVVNMNLKLLWWAAAALLFIIPASILFVNSPEKTPPVLAKQENVTNNGLKDIAPGGNVATLTLSDGSVITLDQEGDGTIIKEGNIDIVKLKDGQLAYDINGKKAAEKTHFNTIATPMGGQYSLTLSDGTRVWLNAASSLRFPAAFHNPQRRVEMKGEIYFDIAKDVNHPFIVSVNGIEVEVTGTQFNVNAYNDEQSMKITLLEGGVTIGDNEKATRLQPGQQAEISGQGDVAVHKNVDISEVISWKEGIFHFNKADIPTVMRQLARWYNVEVEYKTTGKKRAFKGEIQRDLELSQVIKILKKNNINIERSGRKITVSY